MKRGSRRALVGVFTVVGAVVFFGVMFSTLYRGVSLDPQFPASGNIEVSTLDHDRYYLWDNYVTMFKGERLRHSSKFPDDVEISVKDGLGQELEFTPDTSHSWSIGNHSKRSIGYVEAIPGSDLTIQITGGDGQRVLSFAKADMKRDLWRKLGGFIIAVIVGGVGVIFGIWGIFVRILKN